MAQTIDGVLLTWGERLFYPDSPRHTAPEGRLPKMRRPTASTIRARIRATVRRSPQVMVKIMSSQKGMVGVRRVLRYISQAYTATLTDDQGEQFTGKAAVLELGELFRIDAGLIPEREGLFRETLHIELGMPAGTVDGRTLQAAVREMADAEFAGRKYAWTFHGHQANPHVHLVVRTMGRDMKRLPTRKADLHRWREQFARALRRRDIEADASRRVVRGVVRQSEMIWRIKAREQDRLREDREGRHGIKPEVMDATLAAWARVHNALAASADRGDQALASEVKTFLAGTPMARELQAHELAKARDQGREQGPIR